MKNFPDRIFYLIGLAALFCFGVSLFVLPSQNELVPQIYPQPNLAKEVVLDLPTPAPYPVPKADLAEPILTATAAAIFDRQSGVFLFKKNHRTKLLPASTVKMMTAVVSLKLYSPLDVLMVPKVSYEGQDMGLVEGELITVEALLYGLLVSSGNDAGQVLAKNHPGGEAKFIEVMNEEARNLHLEDTYFANTTGLENREQASLTSARDLAWLADEALKNDIFARIVSTKEIILRDPQKHFYHPLYNLNQLLWVMPEVKGIKTGWTENAGECLVIFIERDSRELIVVVLGSQDRFGESRRLIEWAFANFEWQELAPRSTH